MGSNYGLIKSYNLKRKIVDVDGNDESIDGNLVSVNINIFIQPKCKKIDILALEKKIDRAINCYNEE